MTILTLLNPDGSTTAATLPEVDDVAALLHVRTNVMGVEVGTFNDDTRPTGQEVGHLINLAAADLAARVGNPVPVSWQTDVRRLAALQAASLVEASYFPQQLDTDQSAYRQFQAMYLNGVEALQKSMRRQTGIASLPVTTVVAESSTLLAATELLP